MNEGPGELDVNDVGGLPSNLRAAPFGVHAETDLRLHKPFEQNQTVTVQGQLISRKKSRPVCLVWIAFE